MAKGIYIGAVGTLPAGYKKVEYIESSGTQYVDTGFKLSSNSRVVMSADLTNYSTNTYGNSFFGARSSDGSNAFLVICGTSANANWTIMYGNNSGNATIAAAGRHEIDFNKNVCMIDGKTVSITASSFNCAYPCFLFVDNKGGTANTVNCSRLKLYSCQIYENGTLVRDYIPCINLSGVAGLYDIVNNKFYGNSGSGTFTAGVEIIETESVARKVKKTYVGIQQFEPRELPEGYTQVEYIESSGTQYVDTGFKPNQDTRLVLDFEVTSEVTDFVALLGTRDGSTLNTFTVWLNKGVIYPQYGNVSYNTKPINISPQGRLKIDMNKNTATINGETVTFTKTNFASSYPLMLLTVNLSGSNEQRMAKGHFYSCQIYDNGTLIHDYVPCTNQTGVGGLYDVVNKKFYGNSGSGSFTVGTSATSTARKVKKGYIGIGGVARPFMSGGELAYYGTITPLSQARYNLAATTVGNYALFGGGQDTMMEDSRANAYNTSLTKVTVEILSAARCNLAATTVGNYALFGGGGNTEPRGYQDVDAYDTSLTRSSLPYDLSEGRYDLAATTVGNYALFGGGTGSSATRTVDAFDSSLIRTTPTTLAKARKQLAATTVGNYALFGGGYRTAADSAVDAYDTSLTRTIATTLSQARYDLAATTVGDYALFGGGWNNSIECLATVDAYDASLTRTTATSLSAAKYVLSATTVGDYALFGGGSDSNKYLSTVDVYDTSLTRTTTANLNTARNNLAATTVGSYALFGGGLSGGASAIVDAYVVA